MQPGILYKIYCFICYKTHNYSVLTNFLLTYRFCYDSINMLGSVCGLAFCRLRARISPPSVVYDSGNKSVHFRFRAGAVRPCQIVLPDGGRRSDVHENASLQLNSSILYVNFATLSMDASTPSFPRILPITSSENLNLTHQAGYGIIKVRTAWNGGRT